MWKRLLFTLGLTLTLALPAVGEAQTIDLRGSVSLFQQVRTVPNITYVKANGWEGKLDVYAQRGTVPAPTVLYIHGGGWVQGTKEQNVLNLLPYLAMGYSVVNVEYRLAEVSLAPAAVEDCRCALRWVIAHAKDYNLDATRLIVAGPSAGGHLALMTGLANSTAGFDRYCFTTNEPKVAAIVDLYGITDIADLLDGPDKKPFPENWPYTVQWLGNQQNRSELARAISPLTYIKPGMPPVISVHGDKDPTVPYAHSVRLHEALEKAGVRHELITVPGGGHGGFPDDQWQRAYLAIQSFLASSGLGVTRSPATGQ
jgi:acetyl esterase/lipase